MVAPWAQAAEDVWDQHKAWLDANFPETTAPEEAAPTDDGPAPAAASSDPDDDTTDAEEDVVRPVPAASSSSSSSSSGCKRTASATASVAAPAPPAPQQATTETLEHECALLQAQLRDADAKQARCVQNAAKREAEAAELLEAAKRERQLAEEHGAKRARLDSELKDKEEQLQARMREALAHAETRGGQAVSSLKRAREAGGQGLIEHCRQAMRMILEPLIG